MREKRKESLTSNVVRFIWLIFLKTFFFFCLVSRTRTFAHFKRNHCRIMTAKLGFASYFGLSTWMGPLSCHTSRITRVIALSKVLDNNIVVNCLLTLHVKKIVLYIYEECIFVSFFSLWRDWNSVCTLKNETPINQSKSSFNLKQYDKDSNEIPIENHVKKVLTYILVLLSASEIRKKMSIMHVQQKLRLAWFILLCSNQTSFYS